MESLFSAEFLSRTFLGNTTETYIYVGIIILIGLLFKQLISKIFAAIVFKALKKYSAGVDLQALHNLLKRPFSLLFLLIIGYIAFNQLTFPESWNVASEEKLGLRMVINKLHIFLLIVSIAWLFLRLIDFFGLILRYKASITESRLDDQLVPFFKDGLKIIIVFFTFFFILASVFKVNIVTLIGGLGIGGLAVALAAKETLENLLGSFTIFLDKPFIVGELVTVGNVTGHVETIGLRSTRIRTLEKSIITVPNKKMVDAEVENRTQRTMWRTKQSISLLYQTSHDDFKKIISEIKNFLDNHKSIHPSATVNLDHFNESSIDVLIIYLVLTSEFEEYIKVKEEVNFKIIEIVRSVNSDFAFPTTSVYIEKSAQP